MTAQKLPAPGKLPQDKQEVQMRPGHLFGVPGVYVSTVAGSTFIPAHCIPDVQRRLSMLSRRLQDLPAAPTLPGLEKLSAPPRTPARSTRKDQPR